MAEEKVRMRLVVVTGAEQGRIYELEEGENLIGRWDPERKAFPEVDLEEADPEAKVSRKHAVIERSGRAAVLRDVGSLNGTILNRTEKLASGEVRQLAHGDEILLGKTLLRFEIADL